MSEQHGKLVMCDRCDKSIFLKDGEYDPDELSLPGAWNRVQFSKIYLTSPAFYTLCPCCSELFDKHHKVFFRVVEKEDEE